MEFSFSTQRLTQAQKNANDKKWYKDQANLLDRHSFTESGFFGVGDTTPFKKKKVNYDLFNNIINVNDLAYVCKPYGEGIGELPATFANRDIVSGKIKVLLGMEMKMPFSWKVVAVNEEATTRKEQQEAGMIRDYVTSEIMKPLRISIEKQLREQSKGKKLTPDEEQQLQQEIASELEAKTPDEVRIYMEREHQDPAEALSRQLLEYLTIEKRLNHKFNKGWKHSCIGGEEIYWVGIRNGEPDMVPVNTLYFDYDKSDDLDFIEDGEWAVYEYRMTPSEVVSNFGSDLTDKEIDRIYQFFNNPSGVSDNDFTFSINNNNDGYTVRVLHTTWKSLRKIGYLTYLSQATGKEEMKIVDENYSLNTTQGDISIDWEWIPEAHEVYKIMDDIYVYARPVPGQHKDLDNLYKCKLPYYGAACDSMNSATTSPMDRMVTYQYLYDIIIYRIELLMASDKGKILIGNINSIPKSAGLDIEKVTYFMEANKILWVNPNEEGNKGNGDVTNMFKEADMSLASNIKQYIELAEYIKTQCGYAIGVTPQMEAQIGPNDAVSNTRQNLVQASYIIQPYFELHNTVKANVITALLESAKVAYSQGKPRKLTYILDDMTMRVLIIDQDLLENSSYGLFVANSSKAADAKQAVEGLAQAALQNQQADLLDIVKIIKAESINEAEELLEAARTRSAAQQQASEKAKMEAEERAEQRADQLRRDEMDHEKEIVILKEEERRKTVIQAQAIQSLGFDPNKDEDEDGTPDVLEVAKFGVDADIKRAKQKLDEEKFAHQQDVDSHQQQIDRQKLENDKKKLKIQASKSSAS
jgi:hypothetical protein